MTKTQSLVLTAAAALSLSAALPAAAVTTLFATSLAGAGEPVPTSPATGSASVSFDDVLFKVTVHVEFAGLTAPASASHIHCCTTIPFTGGAPVYLGFTGFPAANSGTYDNSFVLTSTSFATLLAGAEDGRAYVNIHSPGTYSAGEIRGFLVPVPEPSTYALMLGGLTAVGWAARRRRSH